MVSHNSMWLFCSILCEYHTNPTHVGVNSFLHHPIPPLPPTSITPYLHHSIPTTLNLHHPILHYPIPPSPHTSITSSHTHPPLYCALTTAGLATAHIYTEYHHDNRQDGYDGEGDPQGGTKVQCPQVQGGTVWL